MPGWTHADDMAVGALLHSVEGIRIGCDFDADEVERGVRRHVDDLVSRAPRHPALRRFLHLDTR